MPSLSEVIAKANSMGVKIAFMPSDNEIHKEAAFRVRMLKESNNDNFNFIVTNEELSQFGDDATITYVFKGLQELFK